MVLFEKLFFKVVQGNEFKKHRHLP